MTGYPSIFAHFVSNECVLGAVVINTWRESLWNQLDLLKYKLCVLGRGYFICIKVQADVWYSYIVWPSESIGESIHHDQIWVPKPVDKEGQPVVLLKSACGQWIVNTLNMLWCQMVKGFVVFFAMLSTKQDKVQKPGFLCTANSVLVPKNSRAVD